MEIVHAGMDTVLAQIYLKEVHKNFLSDWLHLTSPGYQQPTVLVSITV